MTHKCRHPGCTIEMKTQRGIEMHERLFHNGPSMLLLQDMYAQTQAQDGVSLLSESMDDQLDFIQDHITISDSLTMGSTSAHQR